MARTRRTFLLLTTLLVGQLLLAGGAWSHAGLTGTTPERGSSHETMPAEVTMQFNEEMNRPSWVTVTAPDGSIVAEGEAEVAGHVLTQPLTDPGIAGTYRVDYRAISTDGHPVKGQWEFTVTTGREVEQSAWKSVTSSPWLVAAILTVPWLVLLGAVVVRRRRRARS